MPEEYRLFRWCCLIALLCNVQTIHGGNMGAPELQENMRIDRIEENSFIFTLRTRQNTHRESELRY